MNGGYAIRIVGLAGSPRPGQEPPIGRYVAGYWPDANEGAGLLETVERIEKAQRFPDMAAALGFWRQESTVDPVRFDGKPNRPLTALTVEIVRVDEIDEALCRLRIPHTGGKWCHRGRGHLGQCAP